MRKLVEKMRSFCAFEILELKTRSTGATAERRLTRSVRCAKYVPRATTTSARLARGQPL